MAKPWTAELVKKALGVKKCNGSMEAATEDLPLEKAIGVAKKAMTREVIGTCVAMRVKIDGHWPKDALKIIENGEWDDRFN